MIDLKTLIVMTASVLGAVFGVLMVDASPMVRGAFGTALAAVAGLTTLAAMKRRERRDGGA